MKTKIFDYSIWIVSITISLSLILTPINSCFYSGYTYIWLQIPLFIRLIYLLFTFGSIAWFNNYFQETVIKKQNLINIDHTTLLYFLAILLFISILQKWGMSYLLEQNPELTTLIYPAQDSGLNSFKILLLCVIPGLFLRNPLGYILVIQLPLYFLINLSGIRPDDWYTTCIQGYPFIIAFGLIWTCICHFKSLRQYWQINSIIQWSISLLIAIGIAIGYTWLI